MPGRARISPSSLPRPKPDNMSTSSSPQQPNTLGNASLGLGIASLSLVFGIGLCPLVAPKQVCTQPAGTPLCVCGASSAFLGLLSMILGLAGLFGANRTRAA